MSAQVSEIESLKEFRDLFRIPKRSDGSDCVYLCGNSLGLMPKETKKRVDIELEHWANLAVQAHFYKPDQSAPWKDAEKRLYDSIGHLIGAKPVEICIANSLTVNLNCLFSSFYKPTSKRYKILFESNSFPSDRYAFQNIVRLHNLDPKDALLQVPFRESDYLHHKDDVLQYIEKYGDEIAIICFPGIQYYTGQLFDMQEITKAGKSKGCLVAWDLAHSIGNVEHKLHDWEVDFAFWCSYKYLNSGPGSIGGFFVHEKYANDQRPRVAGWWGHLDDTRFDMPEEFVPETGACGFSQSNIPVLQVAALETSLEIFKKAGFIENLRRKSERMTTYIINKLEADKYYIDVLENFQKQSVQFKIITPRDPKCRGNQITLLFNFDADSNSICKLESMLAEKGIICDSRKPNAIRVGLVPLYTTINDIDNFCKELNNVLTAMSAEKGILKQ